MFPYVVPPGAAAIPSNNNNGHLPQQAAAYQQQPQVAAPAYPQQQQQQPGHVRFQQQPQAAAMNRQQQSVAYQHQKQQAAFQRNAAARPTIDRNEKRDIVIMKVLEIMSETHPNLFPDDDDQAIEQLEESFEHLWDRNNKLAARATKRLDEANALAYHQTVLLHESEKKRERLENQVDMKVKELQEKLNESERKREGLENQVGMKELQEKLDKANEIVYYQNVLLKESEWQRKCLEKDVDMMQCRYEEFTEEKREYACLWRSQQRLDKREKEYEADMELLQRTVKRRDSVVKLLIQYVKENAPTLKMTEFVSIGDLVLNLVKEYNEAQEKLEICRQWNLRTLLQENLSAMDRSSANLRTMLQEMDNSMASQRAHTLNNGHHGDAPPPASVSPTANPGVQNEMIDLESTQNVQNGTTDLEQNEATNLESMQNAQNETTDLESIQNAQNETADLESMQNVQNETTDLESMQNETTNLDDSSDDEVIQPLSGDDDDEFVRDTVPAFTRPQNADNSEGDVLDSFNFSTQQSNNASLINPPRNSIPSSLEQESPLSSGAGQQQSQTYNGPDDSVASRSAASFHFSSYSTQQTVNGSSHNGVNSASVSGQTNWESDRQTGAVSLGDDGNNGSGDSSNAPEMAVPPSDNPNAAMLPPPRDNRSDHPVESSNGENENWNAGGVPGGNSNQVDALLGNMTDMDQPLVCPLCPRGASRSKIKNKNLPSRRDWAWKHYKEKHPGQPYFAGAIRKEVHTNLLAEVTENVDKFNGIAHEALLLAAGASIDAPPLGPEAPNGSAFTAWRAIEGSDAKGVIELLKTIAIPDDCERKILLQMLLVFWNEKCGRNHQLLTPQYTQASLQRLIDEQNALLAQNPKHKWSI